VQARIGGGSYSTVKRYLDVWKATRAEMLTAGTDIPPEVEARGKEFTAALWALASAQANRQAQAAREEAQAKINALRGELSEARNEIALA
jgi:Plasmid replication region DNA-binding N-term